MSRRSWDGYLRAGSALGLLLIASAQASAGGLGVREQSAYGQGSSFAGVAAGGALSSMFWNPATMTQFSGVVSETVVSGIFPYAANTPTSGLLVGPPFNLGGTSNVGNATPVPAGYTSYQFSPNLWFGVSINAPFGLSESYPDNWAGRFYASGDQLLKTYNATPSLAWQINNWISVGAGVQIQYAKAGFQKGLPGGALFGLPGGVGGVGSFATVEGTGWGFGATAGVTLTPTPTTTIGLGWRSGINQKIEGVLATSAGFGATAATTPGSVTTTVDLPDIVSLGIRQRLDPQWTLLGTVEWTNWSRIGTASILQLSGAPATVLGAPVKVAFQWKDGWFFSGGAEYIWSDRLTVRGGLGYEISPVTDQVRTPIVPDNDRFWASVGATWQVIKGVHFDVAYSHIWVKDPNLNLVAGNPTFITIPGVGGAPYVGNVNAHVDILSAALVIRMDDLEPTLRKPFYK